MPLGSDFGEDMQQRLVGSDQERSALDAPYFLAIHVLFLSKHQTDCRASRLHQRSV